MSDLRQAAQQALEALVQWEDEAPHAWSKADEEAVAALRAALAEPEQEPVAKVELMTTGGNAGLATRIVEIDDHLRERLRPGQMLYTAPPQRKPLTEKQIDYWIGSNSTKKALARAIEAAHGIGEKK